MLRSAALLSPIAYVNQIPSPLAKSAADIFLGEVTPKQKKSLFQSIFFPVALFYKETELKVSYLLAL